jgi:hypothetical protein
VRRVLDSAGGLAQSNSIVSTLGATSALSVEGAIGPHRVWAHANVALEHVKAVRRAFGGHGERRRSRRGHRRVPQRPDRERDDVDTAVFHSLVPVSTRCDDGHGVPDNRVSARLYELPVGVADPVTRLELVQEQLGALKSSRMAEPPQDPGRDNSRTRDRSGTPDGVASRPRPKGRHLDTPRPQHSPYREQVGQRPVVERLHATTKTTFDLGQLRGIAPTSVTHYAAVALANNEHDPQRPSRSMAPTPFPRS